MNTHTEDQIRLAHTMADSIPFSIYTANRVLPVGYKQDPPWPLIPITLNQNTRCREYGYHGCEHTDPHYTWNTSCVNLLESQPVILCEQEAISISLILQRIFASKPHYTMHQAIRTIYRIVYFKHYKSLKNILCDTDPFHPTRYYPFIRCPWCMKPQHSGNCKSICDSLTLSAGAYYIPALLASHLPLCKDIISVIADYIAQITFAYDQTAQPTYILSCDPTLDPEPLPLT